MAVCSLYGVTIDFSDILSIYERFQEGALTVSAEAACTLRARPCPTEVFDEIADFLDQRRMVIIKLNKKKIIVFEGDHWTGGGS